MSGLSEYVDDMLKRHKRLSYRRAAIEAGISESLVHKIISGGRRPRLETLRKLSDRWGTPEDYVRMAELAGYDLPDPATVALADMNFKQILELVGALGEKEREQLILALIRQVWEKN